MQSEIDETLEWIQDWLDRFNAGKCYVAGDQILAHLNRLADWLSATGWRGSRVIPF